jgi:hypothetical protein
MNFLQSIFALRKNLSLGSDVVQRWENKRKSTKVPGITHQLHATYKIFPSLKPWGTQRGTNIINIKSTMRHVDNMTVDSIPFSDVDNQLLSTSRYQLCTWPNSGWCLSGSLQGPQLAKAGQSNDRADRHVRLQGGHLRGRRIPRTEPARFRYVRYNVGSPNDFSLYDVSPNYL